MRNVGCCEGAPGPYPGGRAGRPRAWPPRPARSRTPRCRPACSHAQPRASQGPGPTRHPGRRRRISGSPAPRRRAVWQRERPCPTPTTARTSRRSAAARCWVAPRQAPRSPRSAGHPASGCATALRHHRRADPHHRPGRPPRPDRDPGAGLQLREVDPRHPPVPGLEHRPGGAVPAARTRCAAPRRQLGRSDRLGPVGRRVDSRRRRTARPRPPPRLPRRRRLAGALRHPVRVDERVGPPPWPG